jgi:hypothetical protein
MQPESQGCPGQSVHWRHTRFSFEGITDYRKLERVQMAVTKGHGNPKWMKEETILALDLYLKAGKAIPAAGTSKRVVRTALRSAWVVSGSNPNTIRAETACQGAYKLSRFRNSYLEARINLTGESPYSEPLTHASLSLDLKAATAENAGELRGVPKRLLKHLRRILFAEDEENEEALSDDEKKQVVFALRSLVLELKAILMFPKHEDGVASRGVHKYALKCNGG